jgi:hypothetical protein
VAVGIFFLFFLFFVDDRSLFRACIEATTASFVAMVVGGVAHYFWTNGGALPPRDERSPPEA